MHILMLCAGILCFITILWDAFETIVLPRRVRHRLRLTRVFYQATWSVWSAIARRLRTFDRRESMLSIYGPLSLLLLLAVWAIGLLISFTLIHWGSNSAMAGPEGTVGVGGMLY